ncbi:MAG TPA: helix-turn-helix domain-containing protein [Puia sp.]|nr:helix-turn-helix domain-containing protein [Puia sp.]
MVNLRALTLVRDELLRLGLPAVRIEISELDTGKDLTHAEYEQLRLALSRTGIEFVEDKKDILVQAIKSIIMEVVYHRDDPLTFNLSAHLSTRLNHDYTYMSNLFSERLSTTIEKFYICHKIDRVKELLLYEGLTLTEIASKMHYSSLAHLCGQFKKVTGLTTSQFKRQNGWKQPVREKTSPAAHGSKL